MENFTLPRRKPWYIQPTVHCFFLHKKLLIDSDLSTKSSTPPILFFWIGCWQSRASCGKLHSSKTGKLDFFNSTVFCIFSTKRFALLRLNFSFRFWVHLWQRKCPYSCVLLNLCFLWMFLLAGGGEDPSLGDVYAAMDPVQYTGPSDWVTVPMTHPYSHLVLILILNCFLFSHFHPDANCWPNTNPGDPRPLQDCGNRWTLDDCSHWESPRGWLHVSIVNIVMYSETPSSSSWDGYTWASYSKTFMSTIIINYQHNVREVRS